MINSCFNLRVKHILHLSFSISSVAAKRNEKHNSENQQNANYMPERVPVIVVDYPDLEVVPNIVSL